jgi:hypothetical protein
MSLDILGKIIIVSGTLWYVNRIFNNFNKHTNDYSKIFPTYHIDIDKMILSVANKETLISLSTVSKYLNNVINDNSFWRLRMETRLGLTTKNNDVDFKLVTNLLDNDKRLSTNMALIFRDYELETYQQIYDILGENKIYRYCTRFIKNKKLKQQADNIYQNIFRPPHKVQYDFIECLKFINETIILINRPPNKETYSFLKRMTDIMTTEIVVNFENKEEIITTKCNRPIKLIKILFEFSRKLEIKRITISNIDSNSDILNELLYKIIERLTHYEHKVIS